MPIRIKPDHDLGPCILNLDGIKGIADRVNRDFSSALYSAHDGIWEVYHEPKDTFLETISGREQLDSFVIDGEDPSQRRKLAIVFDNTQACISLIAAIDDFEWFEHFLIDLKKHILPPKLFQSLSRGNRVYLDLSSLLFIGGFGVPIGQSLYCRINLRAKPPNPFFETIKVNLVLGLIWAWLIAGAFLAIQLIKSLL